MKTKIRLKCRHFNGIQNDVCQAGVIYKELVDKAIYLPCLGYNEPGEVECSKCDRYTEQEVIAIQEKRRKSAALSITLIASIVQLQGNFGTVDCPKCNGQVDWSRSVSNGHIHACCRTQGCLVVMQ